MAVKLSSMLNLTIQTLYIAVPIVSLKALEFGIFIASVTE